MLFSGSQNVLPSAENGLNCIKCDWHLEVGLYPRVKNAKVGDALSMMRLALVVPFDASKEDARRGSNKRELHVNL